MMPRTKAPRLAQLQMREQPAKSTSLKVRLPADLLDDLRMIQAVLGQSDEIPAPSIHAIIIKAARNYVENFLKYYKENTHVR